MTELLQKNVKLILPINPGKLEEIDSSAPFTPCVVLLPQPHLSCRLLFK